MPKVKPVEKREEVREERQEEQKEESMVEHLQPDQIDIVKKVVMPNDIKVDPKVVPDVPTVPTVPVQQKKK